MTERISKGARIPGLDQAARIQPGAVLQNLTELMESGLILWEVGQNWQECVNNTVTHLTFGFIGL